MTYEEMFAELQEDRAVLFQESDLTTFEDLSAFKRAKGAIDAALVFGRLEIREGLVEAGDDLSPNALARYRVASTL